MRCLSWQRRDTSLGEQLPGIINPKGGSDGLRVFLISKVEVGCWPIELAEVLRGVPLYGTEHLWNICLPGHTAGQEQYTNGSALLYGYPWCGGPS